MNKNKSLNVSLVCFTVVLVSPRSIEAVCCIQSGSNSDTMNSVEVACPGGLYPAARNQAMVCDDLNAGGSSTCIVLSGNTGFAIDPETMYEFLCCTSVMPIVGGGVQVMPEACPPPCFETRGDLNTALASSSTITTAEETYGPIKDWCFDAMSLSQLFVASTFNRDISGWDVSKITDMESMFSEAFAFNQPIGNWNVGQVTTMESMFREASAFNQPIGNWNVEKVRNMELMFAFNAAFNQPIGNWNVGQVTNMIAMFVACVAFNKPIGNWNVEKVRNMNSMFDGAGAFDEPIGNWNVGQVTHMSAMFLNAAAFNQPIGNWNVEKVTDMGGMFQNAGSFNQDLCNWGPRMQANPMTTIVSDMFVNSDCPAPKGDPVFPMDLNDPVEPLCTLTCPSDEP